MDLNKFDVLQYTAVTKFINGEIVTVLDRGSPFKIALDSFLT